MAREKYSRCPEDAMQIASGYAASGSIFEISPSQRACRLPAGGRRTACDTVSISEEAWDAWNENRSDTTSLTGQFRSAVAAWKTQPQDGRAVQEKLRALQEEAAEQVDGQESGAAAGFRKQFAAYRGNGIFAESADTSENTPSTTPEDAQAAESETMGKKASELERKIKDLTAQLEAVMASGMPETEKDAMSTRISKEIEELQSQLTAYKQAEKALSAA